jgi:transposase
MNRTAWLQERRMKKFIDVLGRYEAKRLCGLEAAEILGMSERTFRRYRERYDAGGLDGLVDGRLGNKPAHAVPVDEIEWMLEQYREYHEGWTAKHFHDHLVKQHSFNWGYTWTKTQLHRCGLLAKARHRGAHRRKRPRKPCTGMLLHQDGSSHEWLEGQPALDLIVTLDDATSQVYSAFLIDEEGTASTFQAFVDVFTRHGLPSSVYTDRGSHYFHTPEAGGKVDKSNPTQAGRALRQLGIEHIPAYSPEARGRSERAFATFQDRLIKELKLHGITAIKQANDYIRHTYVPDHNARFAVAPEDETSAFVPVADPALLRDILCIQHGRIVAKDNTVSYKAVTLQLPPSAHRRHYVKATVRVHEYPDGTLAVFHGPRRLAEYAQNGQLIEPQSNPKQAPANRCGERRPVDMVDKPDGLPTYPQEQQQQRTIDVL